jgi:hypothetical protein
MQPIVKIPALSIRRLAGYREYVAYRSENETEISRRLDYEVDLARRGSAFTISGLCFVCGVNVTFRVGFEHTTAFRGVQAPVFRETVNCSNCGFNNRMRAAFHIFETLVPPDGAIYLVAPEQLI